MLLLPADLMAATGGRCCIGIFFTIAPTPSSVCPQYAQMVRPVSDVEVEDLHRGDGGIFCGGLERNFRIVTIKIDGFGVYHSSSLRDVYVIAAIVIFGLVNVTAIKIVWYLTLSDGGFYMDNAS